MTYPMVKLKDCCSVVGGATPKRNVAEYWSSNDIPWVTPKDISKLKKPVLEDAPEYISQKGYDNCSAYILPKDSILLTSRAPIGNVAITGKEMCTNQGFKSLVPNSDVDSLYLYYCMIAYSQKLNAIGNGATFKEVSKKLVEEFEIPLPALKEQKRISAILSKADSIYKKRQEAIQLVDEFIRAVFLDMFSSKENIEEIVLDDLVYIKGGGTPARNTNEYWGGNIPWATVKDFKCQTLDKTKEYITTLGVKKSATNIISAGNIIVPTRMSVGKVAINSIDMAINQDLKAIIIKDSSRIKTEYLLHYLMTKEKYLISQAKGATVKGITLDVLKGLAVPVVSIEEQNKFLKIRNKMICVLRETQSELSNENINSLFPSLSQKAFTGEL